METAGGYAKEASDEYKKKQAEMMKEALKKNDIVIWTALIPGKPAPRILTEDLVKLMKPGSIIYDLAAEQGGNSAFSEAGKINTVDGIITNFHTPKSSLLLLVFALLGKEKTLRLYKYAIENRLRFFSYGDACLIWNKNEKI